MDQNRHDMADSKFLPIAAVTSGTGKEITEDIYYYTNQIVNVTFVGAPGTDEWVLIDAGMPASGEKIKQVAEERYGKNSRPKAIILTHGHFDHVGGLIDLVNHWEMPVYAHVLEHPFLSGQESYPTPDATVEGGLVAKMSFMFPHKPIDLGDLLHELPKDGSVPKMPGWQWLHTPGHAPGHVSLFREDDRTLIAGDAFITVKQDALYKVLSQKEEVQGPPRYLTTDWQKAWESVKKLAALDPEQAVTGHGIAMSGEELKVGLQDLVDRFERVAIPDDGKYVNNYFKH